VDSIDDGDDGGAIATATATDRGQLDDRQRTTTAR
jgi:hypothetical protein